MAKDINPKNEKKDLLGIIAIVLFVIALIVLIIAINKTITGNVSTGYVNLTISSNLAVNLSVANISWGPGTINVGETNATLYTDAITNSVFRGNWTNTGSDPDSILIENIGNVNTTITIAGTYNASELFGAVGEQMYQWNLTNKEVGACNGVSLALDTYTDANVSNHQYCSQFEYDDGRDEIYLNIMLTVPYNTTNMSKTIADTITVTATTAA